MKPRRHPQPGAGPRQLRAGLPAVRRPEHLEGRAGDHRRAARRRPAVRHRHHHPQLPALLAPQDAGDLPRRGAVVRAHGRRRRRVHEGQGAEDAAPDGAGGDRRDRLLPRERPRPAARHDRQPARLVHQPPAQLGRAAAVLPAQGQRRAAPAHDGDPGPGRRHRRARRRRGLEPRHGRGDPRRGRRRRTTPRAPTSSRCGSTPAPPSSTCCAARTRAGRRPRLPHRRPRGRPLPGRPRPAPRLVPQLAAAGLRARGPRALPRPAHARLHGRRPGPQDEQVAGQRGRAARAVQGWAPRSSRGCGRATDYSGDLAIDDNILARVVDAYRRIRNTLRFLLANT
jgi:hypothetical protein